MNLPFGPLALLTFSLTLFLSPCYAAQVTSAPTFTDANWVSMGTMTGASGDIHSSVADSFGNLYVGGNFAVIGGVPANFIAKWNGTNWSALGSGMNTIVYALAVSGSSLYAAGDFTIAGGVPASGVAKWNGTNWSALGSGISGRVFALAISPLGDLYAGGDFTTAGDIPARRIARWNGTDWSSLGSGANNAVYALAVSGGDLYMGGGFTTAGSVTANHIARWNGTAWSALGSGMSQNGGLGSVSAIAVSGGTVYAGGNFRTAGTVAANNVARWDGSGWSALGAGLNSFVGDLAISGGNIFVSGLFTNAGGSNANFIARWNGSNWSALGSGLNSSGNALAASGTNIFVGGAFTIAGGSVANRIAKWNGTSWSSVDSVVPGSGLNNSVLAFAISGGDVYAGGAFTAAGTNTVNYIARWKEANWFPLGSGLNGSVRALATSGSDVYAGGDFTSAGGSNANRIARWNGTNWTPLGSGLNAPARALAVSGSDVYVGGDFTTAGGSNMNHIARWNGSSWSALGSGIGHGNSVPTPYVSALAVADAVLYAAGAFGTAGGIAANCIARWDGTNWNTLGSGFDFPANSHLLTVDALVAISSSEIYAAGRFLTAGGVSANSIAKWNGISWAPLGAGLNNGTSLAVSNGEVYAGGIFFTGGGAIRNDIAKWNGGAWSALGSGVNSLVRALAVSGTNLFVGGNFSIAGGKPSAYVAKAELRPDPPQIAHFLTNQTGATGGQMELCVSVLGASPFSSQWRFNGADLSNSGRISGATTGCLLISNLQAQDAGSYSVVISNISGAITSSVIALTVESNPWVWAKRLAHTTNPEMELAIGMVLDAQQNVHVTGWFDGTNDFGGVTLTNRGAGGQDIFVAKYNSVGALQWARQAGSATPYWNQGRGIGVDALGNVYVTGGFRGSAEFGAFTLTAPTDLQFFLAKYNAAGGLRWVQQSSGGLGVYGTGLAVDSAGNSYAIGYADNGALISFGTTNLLNPSFSGYSIFLVKYDTTGAVQWAQLLGGSDDAYATKIALDTSGNIYVRGGYSQNLAIGNTNLLASSAEEHLFIAKFNNNGTLIWVQQAIGGIDEGGVAVDNSGNVYVSGGFESNVDFGGITLTNLGSVDAFIAKYNSAGLFQWARRAAGAGADFYFDIGLDAHGDVYAAGVLASDAFQPKGTGAAMVAKYDSSGTLQWAHAAHGPAAEPISSLASKIAIDPSGNVYLAGWHQPTTTFGTNVLEAKGHWNFFLSKLAPASVENFSITARPTGNNLTLTWPLAASAYRFESTLSLTPSIIWTQPSGPFQTNADSISIVLPMSDTSQFFRLHRPQ